MNIKSILFQIAAWGLCIALGVKLFYLVQNDMREKENRIAALQIQAEEVEKTDDDNLEERTQVYDKLYSQLVIPEMVCWGDSAMAGNRKNSLALAMEQTLDDNLFASLRKTFGRVLENEKYTTPEITITNMGVSNENMRQILVRAGVNTLELGDWIQIPGEIVPVTVRLMDDEAWNSKEKDAELKFAKQSDVSFGKVQIAGIEGSLITTDDWFDSTHPQYAFVRDEEGYRQSIGSGTEVVIETATKFIGDIPVFFFEDDTGRSVDGFVSDIEKLVNRYADLEAEEDVTGNESWSEEDPEAEEEPVYELPFVVVCTAKEGSDLNKALERKFGDRYIRNEAKSSEMDYGNYRKLAQEVYDNLDEQGCFTDVKGQIALSVEEAEQR